MATSTTKTTTASKATAEAKPQTSGITKVIQDNTPVFVSKNIISATNTLENFRLNSFNSVFIFYPILGIIVFLILRYFYRKIF